MFSGHTIAGSCIVSMFVVATPFIHRNLKIFEFFLVAEDLLRCTEAKNLSRAQLCPCLSRVNPNNEDVDRVAQFITCKPYLYLMNTLCCFGLCCVNPKIL